MVMGDRRSKVDYVHQVSTSIYVTNFPNHFSYRDLWRACDDYEKVIDVFIPNKRSKYGNRYGFVRFIKIGDIDRLVKNLCTIWFGRMRLHANVVRFQRTPMNKRDHPDGAKGVYKTRSKDTHKDLGQRMKTNSYAVKEFGSISNLPVVLSKEGFENLKVRYLGGCWVDIKGIPLQAWTQNTFAKIASKWGEFIYAEDNDESCLHTKHLCIKLKSQNNIFETFKFIAQGKVYWIRTKETFGWVPEFMEEELAPNESDDEMLDEDLNIMDEELKKETKLDVHSNKEEVPESSFVHEQMHANDDEQGHNNIKTEVSKSEDPFRIYDILNKKVDNKEGEDNSSCSIPYPPGFTPLEDGEVELNKSDDKEGHVKVDKQKDSSILDDYMQLPTQLDTNSKVETEAFAYKVRTNSQKKDIKDELTFIDLCIDQRDTYVELLFKRKVLMKSLQEIDHLAALEIAQKSKIDDPVAMKNAFLLHFKDRFSTPLPLLFSA
ncbi:nucleotide-binding alpha-beta plait domain-containing protein [Tanacetum coccineum]